MRFGSPGLVQTVSPTFQRDGFEGQDPFDVLQDAARETPPLERAPHKRGRVHALARFDPANGMKLAVWAAVALFGCAFALHSFYDPSFPILARQVNVLSAGVLLVASPLFFLASLVAALRRRDPWVAIANLLAVFIGGAMFGVVEKEPGSFFGVTAGIFASVFLAVVISAPRVEKAS